MDGMVIMPTVADNTAPQIHLGPSPPVAPDEGDFWYDTTRGFLFLWWNDGNTTQWIVANPGRGHIIGPAGGDLGGLYPNPTVVKATGNADGIFEIDAIIHADAASFERLGVGTLAHATMKLNVFDKSDNVAANNIATFRQANNADATNYTQFTMAQVATGIFSLDVVDQVGLKGALNIMSGGGRVFIGAPTSISGDLLVGQPGYTPTNFGVGIYDEGWITLSGQNAVGMDFFKTDNAVNLRAWTFTVNNTAGSFVLEAMNDDGGTTHTNFTFTRGGEFRAGEVTAVFPTYTGSGVVLDNVGWVSIVTSNADWPGLDFNGMAYPADKKHWAMFAPSDERVGQLRIEAATDTWAVQHSWIFDRDGSTRFPGDFHTGPTVGLPDVVWKGVTLEGAGWVSVWGDAAGYPGISLHRTSNPPNQQAWQFIVDADATGTLQLTAIDDAWSGTNHWRFSRDGSTTFPGSLTASVLNTTWVNFDGTDPGWAMFDSDAPPNTGRWMMIPVLDDRMTFGPIDDAWSFQHQWWFFRNGNTTIPGGLTLNGPISGISSIATTGDAHIGNYVYAKGYLPPDTTVNDFTIFGFPNANGPMIKAWGNDSAGGGTIQISTDGVIRMELDNVRTSVWGGFTVSGLITGAGPVLGTTAGSLYSGQRIYAQTSALDRVDMNWTRKTAGSTSASVRVTLQRVSGVPNASLFWEDTVFGIEWPAFPRQFELLATGTTQFSSGQVTIGTSGQLAGTTASFTGEAYAATPPLTGTPGTRIATVAFVNSAIIAAATAGVSTTVVGLTPPPSPVNGQLWFYTDSVLAGGELYLWYNDGNTSQWVPASPSSNSAGGGAGGGGDFMASGSVPMTGPLVGVSATFTTNSPTVTTNLTLANSSATSSGVDFIQSVGGRYVRREVAYAAQALIENNVNLPNRYSDFNTTYFRSVAGANLLVLDTASAAFSVPATTTQIGSASSVFSINAASGLIHHRIAGTIIVSMANNMLRPVTSSTVDLGATSNRWYRLYCGDGDFTGTLTAATATLSAAPAYPNNSTSVATTAYVTAAIAAGGGGSGDFKADGSVPMTGDLLIGPTTAGSLLTTAGTVEIRTPAIDDDNGLWFNHPSYVANSRLWHMYQNIGELWLSAKNDDRIGAATNFVFNRSGGMNMFGPLYVASPYGAGSTATPAIRANVTWNNAAIDFTAYAADVTNTASGANSKLINLKVGGTSVFSVSTTGALVGTTATFVDGDFTIRRNGTDTAAAVLFSGVTKGIRFGFDSTRSTLEGVDNTGVGSFQPLWLSGSVVNINAPLTGATAAFTGNVTAPNIPVSKITVAAAPPSSPAVNDIWIDTN